MTLAVIDVIFIVIIALSAIHGAIRGFLDELFSKLAIILGLFCGLFYNKLLVPAMPAFNGISFLSNILAFLIIFIVVYITVRIVQKIVGFVFQGDIMRGLDRSLGFFLGIAEGFLVVALLLFLLHSQQLFNVSSILSESYFDRLLLPFFATIPEKTRAAGNVNV